MDTEVDRGNGTSYARLERQDGSSTLVRLEVVGLRAAVPPEAAGSFTLEAVVLDGRPFVVQGVTESLEVELILASEHLLEVADTEGTFVRTASVIRPVEDLAFGGSRPTKRPVQVVASQVLSRVDGLAWLRVPGVSTYRWVGAPLHTYSLLEVPRGDPAVLQTRLDQAADLRLQVVGDMPAAGVEVEITDASGTKLRTRALRPNEFVVQGLQAGPAIVSAHSLWDPAGDALCRTEPVLRAGSCTAVELGPLVESSSSGILQGTILVEPNSIASRAIKQTSLSVSLVVRADGTPLKSTHSQVLTFDSMFELVEGETFAWSAGVLDPGGYRIEVRDLGLVVDTWVSPGQVTDVPIEIPELASLKLFVTDRATGRVLDVSSGGCFRAEAIDSHGIQFQARVRLRRDRAGNCLLYVGIPGRFWVSFSADECGEFWQEVVAEAGEHQQVFEAPRAAWVEVEFAQVGPDGQERGLRWFGTVELYDGENWISPRWHGFQLTREGASSLLLMNVEQGHAFDLRFSPNEGYPALKQIRVPAADADPSDSSGYLRRQVKVVAGN